VIGTALNHYRVTGKLGAGGMGEVWRAEDEKLGREVALKVLPADVAGDPERLARFEREAKLLASLNHPNIAHLYGLESAASGTGADAESTTFLVMELVEGEGLDELIARGPVPVDEAVPIALQIAEALEAAHEAGIVHRDLKPANVKIRPDGTVKVLDFGLAKAWEEEGQDSGLSLSPTVTQHATAAGVILGTAAYMSPEQARGKPVDRRADIWAFGVVLWEMLTGRKLFDGETVSDVMAAILTREPDLDELPEATPGHLCSLLGRCLRRDPTRRQRDIGDVRLELQEPRASDDPGSVPPIPRARRRLFHVAAWSAVALSMGMALIFGLLWLQNRSPASPDPVALSVVLPPGSSFSEGNSRPLVSLSPDGSEIVINAVESGVNRLYRRSFDSPELEAIEGTEGGNAPFHSPDGRWIGFSSTSDGSLKKLSLDGGQVVALAEGDWGGGSWGEDDTIVYTPAYTDGLWRVSASGGDARELTRPEPSLGELNHSWPDHVPGTGAVIFTSFRLPLSESRVELLDLETGDRRMLIPNAVYARYVTSGHLLFVRDRTLMASRFDRESLELVGPPVPVLADAFVAAFEGNSQFAVSDTGILAWVPASILQPPSEVVIIDRQGKDEIVLEADRRYSGPVFSPDGRRLALTVEDGNPDIWIFDLDRRISNRVTSSPRSEHSPVWFPDGDRLAIVVDDPPFNLYSVSVEGSGDLTPIFRSHFDSHAEAFLKDGSSLLIRHSTPGNGSDLKVLPLAEGAEPTVVRGTRFNEEFSTVSPDGRAIAYHANDSGSFEVFVQLLVGKAQRTQVSRTGGVTPRWGSNGELYYWNRNQLVAVPVTTGPRLEIGEPSVLFEIDRYWDTVNHGYAVSPDGEHFVMTRIPEELKPREIRVVLNWFSELDRLVGGGADR
jgi:serine/threonine-protein kinase